MYAVQYRALLRREVMYRLGVGITQKKQVGANAPGRDTRLDRHPQAEEMHFGGYEPPGPAIAESGGSSGVIAGADGPPLADNGG